MSLIAKQQMEQIFKHRLVTLDAWKNSFMEFLIFAMAEHIENFFLKKKITVPCLATPS